ncbi:MAG: ribosome biogenesis GTPase Der [Candidatus Magasanikbacteria bacterium RIFOXYD2_FULL_41_14]|uniref:GTPase Der n=1 Tax=Candidatus Magasanikbacteria bacterium RIFOXYD2_FULL_41_14 TaxID=1798709 RepID=A0A1F6PEX0_9BACT|nr:MAG: ribosome biogenesis GTPase Der [Candidatus Magasanikbacteria bacterium RIFOXYD2_FULL_41_14]
MSTPAQIIDRQLPTVALIGRVNVGKSTLFNKITTHHAALVSSIAGTTRTRNIGIATWRGKSFRLIDTGGLTFNEHVPLEKEIIAQTEIALKEADVIVFVADIKDGILPQEKTLTKNILRKKKKPVILVANKADRPQDMLSGYEPEWLKLGLGEPQVISAQTGGGVGDLLDKIFSLLNKQTKRPKTTKEFNPIKVAIMGRPNVGKSSLFNKLIGEERVIVSDMAHTTREPHDTLVQVDKQYYLFIDTAGIRRKAKVNGQLERVGIGKSLEVLNRADIILFVLDTSEPISDQDQQLAGFLEKHAKSVIIVVNKWDLADDNSETMRKDATAHIYARLPQISFAPIVFVSAKTGFRTHQIFPDLLKAQAGRKIEIERKELDSFLHMAVKRKLPTRGLGVNHPRITGLHQIGTAPPVMEVFIKNKTSLHSSYLQYLKKRLREKFGFYASPIIIRMTKLKK